MSEEGKQAALAIAEQMRVLSDERDELRTALLALLKRAANELADPEDVWELDVARAALAKAGPR